jgi:hypothetical protein
VVKDPVAAEKLGKQFLYTKLARCATHSRQTQRHCARDAALNALPGRLYLRL